MSKEKKAMVRDQHGRFIKGISGNPEGRTVGSKNHIVKLREATEAALRDYLASDTNQVKAMKAIDRCMNIALEADDKQALGAMKLLFDKILPNARSHSEEEAGKQRPIAIQIVNQTGETGAKPVTVIDGETFDESVDSDKSD